MGITVTDIPTETSPHIYIKTYSKTLILKRRTIHIKNRTWIFLLRSLFIPKYLKIEHHYRKIDLVNKGLLAELCKDLLNMQ